MLDMSRLFTTPATIPPIAIALCQGDRFRHVGLAYRTKSGEMMIHQLWHKHQRVDLLADQWQRFKGRIIFGSPAMDKDRAKAVSGFCRAIARDIASGNSEIAYSFRYDPDACFDRHTGRLAMPNGKGLTCVTYVLVILKTAQLPIIDFDGWPQRDEDVQFHAELVSLLDADPTVDTDHKAEVKAEVRCVRARPEEAAGACLCIGIDDPPQKYPEACASGLVMLCALHAQQTL